MPRPWHEQLADSNEDVRYAAAKKLVDASRIDVREVRALVVALEDRGYGLESVPDHNGGYQDDPFPIADVAEEALRKHARGHRAALELLARTANDRVRAVLTAILADQPSPPSEQARFDACRHLEAADAISDDDMRALVAALSDTGHGTEDQRDGAGDIWPQSVSISSAAYDAIVRHKERHREVVIAAAHAARSPVRGLLVGVLPDVPPWREIVAFSADPDPDVRKAAIVRARYAMEERFNGWGRRGERSMVPPAVLAACRPLARVILAGVLDAEPTVVHTASWTQERDGHPWERKTMPLFLEEGARASADLVPALVARLSHEDQHVSDAAARTLGWFSDNVEAAAALASASERR